MIVLANCFNLDDRFFLKIKEKPNQYFGYSIGFRLHSDQYKILVGAPKANDSRYEQESGAIYECNIAPPQNCRMVDLNLTTGMQKSRKNQWMGVSLDISPKDSKIIVCAHRYQRHLSLMDSVNGACYEMNDLNPASPKTEYKKDDFNQLFGISCRYSQMGKILIGAPGYRIETNGGGYFFVGSFHENRGNDLYEGYWVTFWDETPVIGKPKYKQYGAVKMNGDLLLSPQNKYTFGSYFGSAISAVDVNRDGYKDLVIGAPLYSKTFPEEGIVYIYIFDIFERMFYDNASIILQEPSYRSHFGQSLLTGDIDLDGYQDVIVGAPYENDGSGCIYVYNGNNRGLETTYSQKINGESLDTGLKSFGISFTRLTDLDQNKYGDIGVGAYLSDSVFIFKARPTYSITAGLFTSERILSMQPNCKLNDRPVICINLTVTLNIAAQSDMEYNLNLLTDSSKIPDEKRTYLNGGSHEIEELVTVRPSTFQKVYQIFIKNTMDIMSPMEFILHYSLKDKGYSNQCKPLCPISKNGTVTETVKFNLECGSDEICQTHLKVRLKSFPPNVTLGQDKKLVATINVFNEGENAYNTRASVFFSPFLDFESVDKSPNSSVECTSVDKMELFCFLGNPIKANSNKLFNISFSLGSITNVAEAFVAVNASTESLVEAKYLNNTVNVTIKFYRESKLELTGTSSPDALAFRGKDVAMTAKHLYQLRNNGPSNAFGLIFSVDIPYFTINNSPLMTIKKYQMHDENRDALKSNDSVCHLRKLQGTKAEFHTDLKSLMKHGNIANCSWLKCHRIECAFPNLTTTNVKIFEIAFNIDTKILKQFQNKLRVFDVVSNGTLRMTTTHQVINLHQDQTAVTTSFIISRLREKIQWWIVVISIIIGLIFLIILGIVLWKFGFFARKRVSAEERQSLAIPGEKSETVHEEQS